jgi:hypothetical protein
LSSTPIIHKDHATNFAQEYRPKTARPSKSHSCTTIGTPDFQEPRKQTGISKRAANTQKKSWEFTTIPPIVHPTNLQPATSKSS